LLAALLLPTSLPAKGKMNRRDRRALGAMKQPQVKAAGSPTVVASLLDSMADGKEYASIVGVTLPDGTNMITDAQRALREIAAVRGRPCLMYVGNVANGTGDSAVIAKDDLPFVEMVQAVPEHFKEVDVLLATNGGSGAQVARFVNCLRSRFDQVDFLLPSFCMSAGTLFALSGDRIWMTPNACLGPIDPQVPNQSGHFVPAQALVLLVEKLQSDGAQAMKSGQPVPWTAVRIIDSLDKKDLADAMTASAYSANLAFQFLEQFKFKNWHTRHSSQEPVTPEYRAQRAQDIANALASHDRWKSHGHAISRDVLWKEIRLQIDHPAPALERVIRRAWAVCYWLFDKARLQKMIMSEHYSYVTWVNPQTSVKRA
jgi:hypothetical protein